MLAIVAIAIGAVGVAYSYFIYPVLLLMMRDAPRLQRKQSDWEPRLTLVIAARNEERRIRDKLRESVSLRSSYANLEILVASDASTDGTDDIVEEFEAEGVELVRTKARNGKEYAQKAAIAAAAGEIIVFTDTGTTIVPDSLARIVEIFRDPSIGAVSSTDRLLKQDGSVSGEGLYIRYEMWLRELESRKAGLIGLSGSFFAARREVCVNWDTDIPSDFAVAINCNMLGRRAVSDPQVIGVYLDTRDPSHEFARKVRTMIRGMTAVARNRRVLNPLRFGRLSFQLWSHKVMRWAVPWFALIYTAGAVLALSRSTAFSLLLVPVAGLLVAGGIGSLTPSARGRAVIGAAYYYVQVNLAALLAAVQFMAGRRVRTWVPTTR